MGKDIKHIAIAGNIGAGKTTLTELIAKHYGWEPHFEAVDNNPYIDDFYDDMQRWSFHIQIYYLNMRFQQILDIKKGNNIVIQDRTIYEDAYIFAPNLFEMGLMDRRDYENYLNLFNTISDLIGPPDLLIYLKSSVTSLVSNIFKRGRSFEENIRLDYLKKLNDRYDEWIDTYKGKELLIIDIDNLNFAENKNDLGEVLAKIDAVKSGLF